MEQLYHLNREPGFNKSLTQKPDIEALEAMLDRKKTSGTTCSPPGISPILSPSASPPIPAPPC